jgi:hypothetical protein
VWETPNVPTWTPRRGRVVDRRRRGYRRWAERRARLVANMDHVPSDAENELLDLLTDRLVEADIRRAERTMGITELDQYRAGTNSEVRRLMITLGLVGKDAADESAGDLSVMLNGKST